MEAYVSHRREGSCGILEFGNPAGNSLPGKLLDQLHKKLTSLLEEDDQVAVIRSSKQWEIELFVGEPPFPR